MTESTIEKVRDAAWKGILFRNHAVVRMTQPDRLITQEEVKEAIRSGEVIEDKLMDCHMCGGKLEKRTAPFSVDRKGYHVHWESLPAWVCNQCGESYFEGEVIDWIKKNTLSLDPETLVILESKA